MHTQPSPGDPNLQCCIRARNTTTPIQNTTAAILRRGAIPADNITPTRPSSCHPPRRRAYQQYAVRGPQHQHPRPQICLSQGCRSSLSLSLSLFYFFPSRSIFPCPAWRHLREDARPPIALRLRPSALRAKPVGARQRNPGTRLCTRLPCTRPPCTSRSTSLRLHPGRSDGLAFSRPAINSRAYRMRWTWH